MSSFSEEINISIFSHKLKGLPYWWLSTIFAKKWGASNRRANYKNHVTNFIPLSMQLIIFLSITKTTILAQLAANTHFKVQVLPCSLHLTAVCQLTLCKEQKLIGKLKHVHYTVHTCKLTNTYGQTMRTYAVQVLLHQKFSRSKYKINWRLSSNCAKWFVVEIFNVCFSSSRI